MSKERLVELMKRWAESDGNDVEPCQTCKGGDCILCSYNSLADYLLANGVVVLPCKVGDVVYQTDGVRIYESSIYEISITSKPIFYTRNSAFNESAIGKSTFLTREEAKAKLKESEKG